MPPRRLRSLVPAIRTAIGDRRVAAVGVTISTSTPTRRGDAQPASWTSFGPISIMGLFDGETFQRAAPAGMTRFDQALLRALYDADPSQPAGSEQQGIIQALNRAETE